MSKITKSAQNEECTLNSMMCNYMPETTVFAHLNESYAGKGYGIKAVQNSLDAGFYACSACHNLYDKRITIKGEHAAQWEKEKDWYVLRAVVRTTQRLIEKGLLVVK